jgi:drug/metabolite transporter (DMT)-like permease
MPRRRSTGLTPRGWGGSGLDALKADAKRDRGAMVPAAVGLTVLSGLLYVLGYALSKRLVATHGLSPLQVTFLRCVVILLVGMAATAWPGNRLTWRRLLRPDKAWQQRLAAAALVASNALAVLAYTLLSVTAASALGFTAPLLLALLGGLVLRERVSLGRWLGTLLGFAGMLLSVKPGGEASLPGIAAAFAGALTYAVYQVFIRRLRDVATTRDTVMQVALVGVVLLALPVAADWRPVGLVPAGLVVGVTLIQTAALASIAAALHRGEASRLAPWQFSGLLWAMALDAVVLQAAPTPVSLFGGLLVVGGGVLAQTLKSPGRS